MMRSYYKSGDYNATCYECGRVRKASELKKHWQGYFVCPEHWEPRHPQDFVRGVVDNQSVPYAQPESDTFIDDCCTPQSAFSGCAVSGLSIAGFFSGCCTQRYAISDVAIADCAIADFTREFSMAEFCVTRVSFADVAKCDCAIADRTSY